jgi:hypothetical protein
MEQAGGYFALHVSVAHFTPSTDLSAALDVARGATYYSPVQGRWDGSTFVIDVTQGPETDNSGIVDSGKQHIFNIEQALWKQGGFRASAIEVEIMVQLVDKNGHESPRVALSATLTRNTAHLWDNLDRDSAWEGVQYNLYAPELTKRVDSCGA